MMVERKDGETEGTWFWQNMRIKPKTPTQAPKHNVRSI